MNLLNELLSISHPIEKVQNGYEHRCIVKGFEINTLQIMRLYSMELVLYFII